TVAADARRAEAFDLSGVARDYLADAVAAALAVPLATDARELTFAPDAYWRGGNHRPLAPPGGPPPDLQEPAANPAAPGGAGGGIVAGASDEISGPHALAAGRLDARARLGEYLQPAEPAAMRDAVRWSSSRILRTFTVVPGHNPIGPFDFGGSYDDRSDRR